MSRKLACFILLAGALLSAPIVLAEDVPANQEAQEAKVAAKRQEAQSAKADAEAARAKAEKALADAAAALHKAELAGAAGTEATTFRGITFGIGLSVSADFKNNIVQKVEAIGDTVRVTERKTAFPRVLLESHYFVATPKQAGLGIGPFVAIQAGGNDVIEALLDNKAQVLMDGVRENRPVPTGSENRLTRETSQWGFMATFSFTP